MTYDVVGPKPTTSYTPSYTISYNNLRHRRSNLRRRRFDLRHRRFLPTCCHFDLRYYLRHRIRHRRSNLRCRMRYYKKPTTSYVFTPLLTIVPYDIVYDIVGFVRHRIRYLRVMSVLYAGVGYYTTA